MKIEIGRVGKDQGHYVGRNGKGASSALGNPFKPSERSEQAHKEVCEQYRKWLWQKICAGDKAVLDELNEIRSKAKSEQGVKLLCFCSPLPCHAEVIRNCVLWMESKDQ